MPAKALADCDTRCRPRLWPACDQSCRPRLWPARKQPRLAAMEFDSSPAAERPLAPSYDVIVFGAGLAGGTLARQVLLGGAGKTILLLDRRDDLPPTDQKVGEATVQVSGFYY